MKNKCAIFLSVFAIFSFLSFVDSNASDRRIINVGAIINSSIPNSGSSYLNLVSANGSTVTGSFSAPNGPYAFKYDLVSGANEIKTLFGRQSYINGISADGSTVVGGNDAYLQPMIYDPIFGERNIVNLFKSYANFAQYATLDATLDAISADGSTIVGTVYNASHEPFILKYDAISGMTNITNLLTDEIGVVNRIDFSAMSADGSTVVGNFYGYSNGHSGDHTFKYDAVSGITNIGASISSGPTQSYVKSVSKDGSVVVGYFRNGGYSSSEYNHAFKYTKSATIDIGALINGSTNSYANSISADGSVVVGYFNNGVKDHAFKYDSIVTDIGALINKSTNSQSTNSRATAVSADGSVVIGYFNKGVNDSAFKYEKSTITDIKYARSTITDIGSLITGATSSYATAVSDDGSVIVGHFNDGTYNRAFIYKTNVVDIANTFTSLYYNAAQLNSIINLKNSLITNNLNQDCDNFGSSNVCLGVSARYSNFNNHDAKEVAGILKVAYKFNPHLRVGIMLDQTVSNSDPSNFVSSNPTPMAVLFSNLSQNSDGSGLNLRLAGSYNKSNLRIRRDNYLTNTEAGKGDTNLNSVGLLAQLSYNQKLTNKIYISPSLGIRRTEISRSAYTETSGADFPITYTTLRQKSTTAIAGINLSFNLTKKLNLSAGGGIESNLQSSMDGYTGDISQIGSFSLKSPQVMKNRAFANAEISYDLKENQSISSSVHYGKQQFNDANVAMVYLGYRVGL